MSQQPSECDVRLESKSFSTDAIAVIRLDGWERISSLFRFEVEIVVKDKAGLDLTKVAGASVTLVFEKRGLPVRRVHGMVASAIDRMNLDVEYRVYRLEIVPHAHVLSLIDSIDVHVAETVPDVIQAKLASVGLTETSQLRLSATYETREFIVQYKESDLALVSRLAEHLGVSFFFEQDEENDRIVFTDHEGGFKRHEERLEFHKRGERLSVFELEARREIVPAAYLVNDYNYRTPLVDLSATVELASGFAGGVFEYGGHFRTPEGAKALANVRAQERQAGELVYRATSDVPEISAGHRFTLEGHPHLEHSDLLVTEVTHKGAWAGFFSESAGEPYTNTFKAIPAERTFRPARTTPRPRIAGVVTGLIDPGGVAGSNEIPYIDDQGRYLVRLLFDGGASKERRASHAIRMAQPHAGPGYGHHFPLRPDVEVIVVFVEGDPDRPIIAGAVPNPLTPSPVTSAESTVNRIRTQSGIVIELHDR